MLQVEMRVDLHVHTRESSSPPEHWLGRLLSVQECYTQAEDAPLEAQRKGLDGIALANHDTAADALRMARARPEGVIPGCEYTVYAGKGSYAHVVVLGIDEEAHERLVRERHRGLGRFTGLARETGLPFFLAHPAWEVGAAKRGLDPRVLCERLKHFDLIEALNGNCSAENDIARGLARYFRKSRVGGSDAHDAASIGTAWTEAEASSLGEFIDRLRAGEVRPGGRAVSTERFAATAREVVGAFYRRELLKAVGAGSVEGYLSKSNPVELLRAAGEALILPGFLWAPQAGTKAYLEDLEQKAGKLRRELVDFLALEVARSIATEEMGEEERRRRYVAGMRELYSAFGGS